ncbi:MAG: Aspartokinase, partial [uncultured Microvirga sp.]
RHGRAHPQRGAPCPARGRGRLRGCGRGLGHGGQDQRVGRLVPRGVGPVRPARIRCRGRGRRAGDLGAARHRAAGCGPAGALLAGLADPDPDLRPPRLVGPHHGHRRHEPVQRLQGWGGRGDRRLPGHPPRDRAHHDARARRLGHQRGGDRGGDPGRALRHLHGRGRRLHDRPPHRRQGAPPRPRLVRGDAGDGLARRQGAAGALGRARHDVPGADLCALELRRPGEPAARHPDLRRGGYCGAADRHRHRLFQGRGPDHLAPRHRSSRCRGRDLHAVGRGQHQCRHDYPGGVGRRHHDRHDLHGAGSRVRARPNHFGGPSPDGRLQRPPGGHRRRQNFRHRSRDAQPCGRRGQGFWRPGRAKHQHPGDHHLRDQVLGPDRRGLHRTRRAHLALPLRPRRGL